MVAETHVLEIRTNTFTDSPTDLCSCQLTASHQAPMSTDLSQDSVATLQWTINRNFTTEIKTWTMETYS